MIKDTKVVVTPISRQTCKKMVNRGVITTHTYLVTLSAEESQLEKDVPFFVRWNNEKHHHEAQLIVLGPTGKYGTAVVNQEFFDHFHKIAKRFLGVDYVIGIKLDSEYYANESSKLREMFPGIEGK